MQLNSIFLLSVRKNATYITVTHLTATFASKVQKSLIGFQLKEIYGALLKVKQAFYLGHY